MFIQKRHEASLLILYCLYLKFRKPFSHWIVYGSFPIKDDSTIKVKKNMTVIQLILLPLEFLFVVIVEGISYFESYRDFIFCFELLQLILIIANIVFCIIYVLKQKEHRKIYVVIGARNVLLNIPVFALATHYFDNFNYFSVSVLLELVALTVIILSVSSIIKSKMINNNKQ